MLDGAVNARTVKVERIGASIGGENILTLAEVQVFGVEAPHPVTSENLTQRAGVTATQSSTYGTWIAPYAIDGDTGGDTAVGDTIAHTQSIAGSWWQVDLGAPHALDRVVIWNREGWNGRRLSNFRLSLLGSGGEVLLSQDFFTDGTHAARQFEWVLPAPVRARTVKLQRIGASAGGENIINIAEVEVFGSTNRLATAARQVIPPAYLESYEPQPEDLDDDDLLDAWELAHGFDPSTWQAGVKSHDADPDRDYLTNHQESMLGLDPFIPDSVRGFLSHEQRFDVPYYSVREAATASDKLYQAADFARVVEESSTGEHQLWDVSQNLRGYIEAPTTGDYYFWISATNGAQLLLSTGDDKYHKRIIAEMGPEMGTEHGVWYGSPTKWDSFACQMSQAVRLEAGQKYFIEVRHQHGHGHYPHADIAWARPSGDREVIPREFIHSYHHLSADGDDDSLPDAWEEDNGLSATDNGLSDRAKEGEDGDFDGDGLSNRAEYVAGTDPSDIDSDNDGLSDLDELRTYGTDPTVSDASGELVVQTVPASSVSGLGTQWTATADGVMTASFRGAGAWNFSVPSAGYWIVQVEGQLRGDLRAEEVVPVEAGVDGVGIGRQSMTFLNSAPGSLRIITPWLSAGSHQLDLFIDNYTARRMVEILSIKVLNPGGLDLDSNGRSDAIERQLGKVNQILPGTVVESWISPAFVEGLARSNGGVEFRHRHEGVGSVIRHKDSFWDSKVPGIQSQLRSLVAGMAANPGSNHQAAGDLLPTAAGPGHGTWHAGVPLQPNQATGYSAFFENGSLAGSGVIVWRPLNLFEVEELSIPLGTSLLMSAWDGESDNSRLEFTIAGTSHEIRALDSLSWEFGTAGDHVVSVLHQKSGEILTLTVHVREAELPGGLTVAENRYATVNLPGVASDLALDANGELGLGTMVDHSAGGSNVVIAGMVPGHVRMAVRMAARDPILDLAEVTVVGISDALRHQNSIVTPAGDGMTLVRSPLLVTYLPPGATVRISIFAGGVTFTDGTTVRILTSADFDENGVLMIEMLMPADRLGAPCHSIEIFDAAGNKIFQ